MSSFSSGHIWAVPWRTGLNRGPSACTQGLYFRNIWGSGSTYKENRVWQSLHSTKPKTIKRKDSFFCLSFTPKALPVLFLASTLAWPGCYLTVLSLLWHTGVPWPDAEALDHERGRAYSHLRQPGCLHPSARRPAGTALQSHWVRWNSGRDWADCCQLGMFCATECLNFTDSVQTLNFLH